MCVCLCKGNKKEFGSNVRQQEEEHKELDNFYNQCLLFITKGKYICNEEPFMIMQNDIMHSRFSLSFFLFCQLSDTIYTHILASANSYWKNSLTTFLSQCLQKTHLHSFRPLAG